MKVSPTKKVVVAGVRLDFTCAVDMSRSLPKYLSLKWFKKVNGTFLEIPDEQTHERSNETYSTSVLVIKNAQTSPPSGFSYKCQMSYRDKITREHSSLLVFSG